MTVLAILGMLNGVPAWYGKEPHAGPEGIVVAFARLVLDGIRCDGGESAGHRPPG